MCASSRVWPNASAWAWTTAWAPAPGTTSFATRMEVHERALLREALRRAKVVVADAADLLHLPRKTMYDKLARYELDPAPFR